MLCVRKKRPGSETFLVGEIKSRLGRDYFLKLVDIIERVGAGS